MKYNKDIERERRADGSHAEHAVFDIGFQAKVQRTYLLRVSLLSN
jgi:hypothetical protein